VGVINDFQNSFSFIDFKDYGQLKIFDACFTKGEKVCNTSSDDISIFLNFKKVGSFKVKLQAQAFLKQLISEAPSEAREFFVENQNVLLDNLK